MKQQLSRRVRSERAALPQQVGLSQLRGIGTQMRFLFPEATIHAERVLGFAKSHTAVALRDNPPDRTAESD